MYTFSDCNLGKDYIYNLYLISSSSTILSSNLINHAYTWIFYTTCFAVKVGRFDLLLKVYFLGIGVLLLFLYNELKWGCVYFLDIAYVVLVCPAVSILRFWVWRCLGMAGLCFRTSGFGETIRILLYSSLIIIWLYNIYGNIYTCLIILLNY